MPDEKEDSSGFKVVDRRGFASDGSRREEATPAAASSASPAADSPAVEPSPPEPPPRKPEDQLGAPGFETLVSYLSTTAFFQLGLLPGPGGERIPPDLPNARRTIDMLEVLQRKTHGNLTAEEGQMLEEVLYEMRMTYVELQKRLAQPSR